MLDAIRASGRPFALFTNGSHMPPAAFARELREAGLPVEDDQVLTPLCSVQTYLERHGDVSVLPFVTDTARGYLEEAESGSSTDGELEAVGAVFVAHPKEVDFETLELAARAVIAGARLLTGSYVAAYAGANGPILSRGAMVTAAIAKASGRRPTIVGKPSRAAVTRDRTAPGCAHRGDRRHRRRPRPGRRARPSGRLADVLVRSGISASVDLGRVPERRRPHLTVDGVADLLDRL